MPNWMEALALGVLVLAVAVFMPTLINSTEGDATTTFELEAGDTNNPTEKLQIEAESLQNTTNGTNATLTVRSLDTLNESTQTIPEGNNSVYTIDGENVTIFNDAMITEGGTETVRITAVYNPKFGWNDGARTFFSNMGIILALLAFIILGAILKSAL